MRIVFDPALDGGGWPGVTAGKAAAVGEAWLGQLGLLDRLETELGLGARHAPAIERACALVLALEGREGWWRESYEADPLGTCQRLLRDRDTLALWGWRGERVSPRLDALWAATAGAPPGLPDRLHDVRAALLAGRRVDLASVEARSPLSTLPTGWTALFEALREAGVGVDEVTLPPAPAQGDLERARGTPFIPSGDGSLTLLRPHGPLAAADEVAAALAALGSLDDVVVVGADEILDAALGRLGLPRLGAPAGPPASAALIRLVLEAAFEPMEPGDLHALLCLDPGPVPRPVASWLVGALARHPGRGSPLWHEAMAGGLGQLEESGRAQVARRLDALLVPAARREGTVAASVLEARLRLVTSWAMGRAANTPSLEAVARLAMDASALIGLLGHTQLSLVEARRLCDELGDARLPVVAAQAGLASVAQPGAVLGRAGTIVWWGFTRERAPAIARVRLSRAESAALRELGSTPPDAGKLMAGEAARWRRPLEQATAALVLVCPATDEAGEKSFPHPLWDELGAAMPRGAGEALELRRLRLPAAPRRRRAAARGLPVPSVTANAGAAISLRPTESPSSLERLLACSLAYALHYHGELQPGLARGPGAPTPLLYGTLAHHVLAQVFAAGVLPAEEAAARAGEIVEADLPRLCESLGLPRYQVERATVKQVIVDAARELGRLLDETGATVAGVEHRLERELLGVTVAGNADLVLSSPDVIVDLKWGLSKYRDKIAGGTALQLATYARLLGGDAARPQVAYFILTRQQLLAEPGSIFAGATIPGKSVSSDTWNAAMAALARRLSELAEGTLGAPAADGSVIKPMLDGGRLVLAPACEYCALGGLCGERGTT